MRGIMRKMTIHDYRKNQFQIKKNLIPKSLLFQGNFVDIEIG